jgi:transposase
MTKAIRCFSNVTLLPLPPYSPELNPVEHNTSRHELNTFNIYESIEYFCKQDRTLELA